MKEIIFIKCGHVEELLLWRMKNETSKELIAIFQHCTGYTGGCDAAIPHLELQFYEPIFLAHGVEILCKTS